VRHQLVFSTADTLDGCGYLYHYKLLGKHIAALREKVLLEGA